MREILVSLLDGEPVGDWFQVAKQHWSEVLSGLDPIDPDAVAAVAQSEQFWFEDHCGGRETGQEIMVAAGIAQYYSTGDGFAKNTGKAIAMAEGLLRSNCSVEIHSHTRAVCGLYAALEDYSSLGMDDG